MSEYFEITYSCSKELWYQKKSIDSMLEDIFYGQMFRVHEGHEEIIPITQKSFRENIRAIGEYDGRYLFAIKIPMIRPGCDILPSLLTQFWGNILDYGSFRLESFAPSLLRQSVVSNPHLPDFLRSKKLNSPYLATVIKPSYLLSLEERIQFAVEFVKCGGDFVKEDETYFSPFEKMLEEVEEIQGALNSIGGISRGLGVYVPNITGMVHREQLLEKLKNRGMKGAMINFLISGFQPVQQISRGVLSGLFLWGHRVGYDCMKNSISMLALIQLSMIAGFTAIHVGTPLIGVDGQLNDAKILSDNIQNLKKVLGIPFLPILSKTTKDIVPELVSVFRKECIILGCGEFRDKLDLTFKLSKVIDWINAAKSTK